MNNEYQNMLQQAANLFSNGELQRAEDLCLKLIKISNTHPDVYNILSIIQDKKGNYEQAINSIEKAISINPNNHLYYVNAGEFYKRKGDIEKAINYLQRSISINPDFPGSRYNLANIYKSIGYNKQAEQLFQEAIYLNPDDYQSYHNLGNLYYESNNFILAAENYFNALRLVPSDYKMMINLGNCFLEMKNNFQAEYYYKNALAFSPNNPVILKSLSVMFENQARFEEAIECYKKYIEYSENKDTSSTLAKQFHLDTTMPAFDLTNFKIGKNRKNLVEKLDKYKDLSFENYDFLDENIHPPSHLAYHGIDNKEIKIKYAEIFSNSFSNKNISYIPANKIKVGFLVTYTNEGIFSRFMKGIINYLNSEVFEVFIICDSRGWEKTLKNNFNTQYIKPVFISKKLQQAAEVIENLKLNLIYHWEVGTDSLNYFLPFFKLAPIQCTSLGWPDTTGINNMNYFISSDLIERLDADLDYSEKLIRLNKLPFNYEKPILTEMINVLEKFNIDKTKNIYFCAQNLRKIHPDFDQIIAGILRKDPNGLIIFVKNQSEKIKELLKLRIEITNPDISDRVLFISRLSMNEYLSMIDSSHVVLDSLYFGGANTSYESFAMNRPIVTFPWNHERGRYTLGCYKQMAIEGLVSNSFEEYIDLAVKTATDKVFREKLISEISENNHKLFDTKNIVEEYENFFKLVTKEKYK